MSAPLALDSTAFGEAVGLRRGEGIVDSLAYIDTITTDEQRHAESLIKEEIKAMGKRPAEYLKELPKLHQVKFEGHPVLQAEYDRVRAEQPMPELDKLRYKCLPPPENRKNDVAAWHSALENAHSQLEHQYNRLLNLELLIAYGPKAWQAHIRSLEVNLKRLEEEAASVGREVIEVNKQRKLKHQTAGEQLASIEAEWRELVAKNRDIGAACDSVEQEIASLTSQLPSQQHEGDEVQAMDEE